MLRIIAGLENVTGGEIVIGGVRGQRVPPAERKIAMVFQSYALYPHMTVYRNMAFGLKIARTAQGRDRPPRARRLPRSCSSSPSRPQARASSPAASASASPSAAPSSASPSVFLFDEPLSNLDAALRVNTRIEIAKLHRELGATMIYVTHDQVEAMTLATKIVVINQAISSRSAPPLELYHRPPISSSPASSARPRMNFSSRPACSTSTLPA